MDDSDSVMLDLTAAHLNETLREDRQSMNLRTIFRFPVPYDGIDDQIKSPELASFGHCHRGNVQLESFERHKNDFLLNGFLRRQKNQGKDVRCYTEKLEVKKNSIRSCYHENIILPVNDDELIRMMVIDGCFMIELFLRYNEDKDTNWEWDVPTLISDLLKLENQIPFFVLEDLFECFNSPRPTPPSTLPKLALTFLNQVFSCSPNMNNPIQGIKHLLDLFRLSLIPAGLQQNTFHPSSFNSLKNLTLLRGVGVRVGKREAQNMLEIDFHKYLPPLNLKIPSIHINNFTRTILFNCVVMEQCRQMRNKYVTAYVCFLTCLMKEAEDVRFLQSVDVIPSMALDRNDLIRLLNDLGMKVYSSVTNCYLKKQVEEINTHYYSCLAKILSFFKYKPVMLLFAILSLVVGILSWKLRKN